MFPKGKMLAYDHPLYLGRRHARLPEAQARHRARRVRVGRRDHALHGQVRARLRRLRVLGRVDAAVARRADLAPGPSGSASSTASCGAPTTPTSRSTRARPSSTRFGATPSGMRWPRTSPKQTSRASSVVPLFDCWSWKEQSRMVDPRHPRVRSRGSGRGARSPLRLSDRLGEHLVPPRSGDSL